MSAFICEAETIQRSAFGLFVCGAAGELLLSRVVKGDELTELGRQLWALNAEAFRQRYGEDEGFAALFKGRCMGPWASLTKLEQVQVFKSMQCLGYQCAEGDVPKTDLFQRLETGMDAVAHLLHPAAATTEQAVNASMNMGEYREAKWG